MPVDISGFLTLCPNMVVITHMQSGMTFDNSQIIKQKATAFEVMLQHRAAWIVKCSGCIS